MRRRSCLVCWGLARASSGSARAWVALSVQDANSCGYIPLVRHHALLLASSIAAVVSIASKRAAAVHTRARAGRDNASLRQRSSVDTPTPNSRDTSSNVALSGGNKRATALSLNAFAYLAISLSRYRPLLAKTGCRTFDKPTRCEAVDLWTMRFAHRSACRGKRCAFPTALTFAHKLHSHPLCLCHQVRNQGSIGATTILTRGVMQQALQAIHVNGLRRRLPINGLMP